MANRLMHPSGNIEKTYRVTVQGDWQNGQARLARPILLEGYRIRPPKVRLLSTKEDTAVFSITIYEGRNRQIRRMCEAADLRVLRLCRIREGALELGALPVGKWRYLTDDEVAALQQEGK